MKPLTRDEFVKQARSRDKNSCVICHVPAEEVHHIIERKLWTDGGYYLNNAATLCSDHHLLAEKTILTCDEIRKAAGISEILLPDHFDTDSSYDKWGNIILLNGTKLKGEMFYFEQVQKIIDTSNFSKYIKYPRTPHLTWSEGATNDDKILSNLNHFINTDVVVTFKMDGENTGMTSEKIHARSLDSKDHISRHWVKGLHGKICYDIPENFQIFGENLTAKHSIFYKKLKSYFYVFNILDFNTNNFLSFDDVKEWCELLNLHYVPILYEGKFNENLIKKLYQEKDINDNLMEGYVVRLKKNFILQNLIKALLNLLEKIILQLLNIGCMTNL